MAKTIKDLRQEKGYRSAREFADALGIATSSMSRYDKDPETIPLKHAWAMADLLHCSIDAVVGRDDALGDEGRDLNAAYRTLSDGGKERFDEYLQFLAFRDQLIASQQAR